MTTPGLTERLLVPTVAVLCSVLAAAAILAATAGAATTAARATFAQTNGFSGPAEAPPRVIQRVLGPSSSAGMKQVRCAGQPAGVASCYVAAP